MHFVVGLLCLEDVPTDPKVAEGEVAPVETKAVQLPLPTVDDLPQARGHVLADHVEVPDHYVAKHFHLLSRR